MSAFLTEAAGKADGFYEQALLEQLTARVERME